MNQPLCHDMRRIHSWKCICNSVNCNCIAMTFTLNILMCLNEWIQHHNSVVMRLPWFIQTDISDSWPASFIFLYFNKTESEKPLVNCIMIQTTHHFKTFSRGNYERQELSLIRFYATFLRTVGKTVRFWVYFSDYQFFHLWWQIKL